MKTKRIIVRLDVKNEALVKGIHLEGLRVLGKPEAFAEHYYKDGVDELLFMDAVASLYGRNSLVELVRNVADKIFVPLTVGGGVRNASDVRALLKSGADKIAINTAAVKSPALIRELADTFGSSTICATIETIRDASGKYFAFIDNGREPTGLDAVEWAQQLESLGAGEIILTSVDKEGTGKGMDHAHISEICKAVSIPVIAHGGVGSVEHILSAFHATDVDAVCAASVFHYDTLNRIDTESHSVRGNTSFLASGSTKKNLSATSVGEAKAYLRHNGINIR